MSLILNLSNKDYVPSLFLGFLSNVKECYNILAAVLSRRAKLLSTYKQISPDRIIEFQ